MYETWHRSATLYYIVERDEFDVVVPPNHYSTDSGWWTCHEPDDDWGQVIGLATIMPQRDYPEELIQESVDYATEFFLEKLKMAYDDPCWQDEVAAVESAYWSAYGQAV